MYQFLKRAGEIKIYVQFFIIIPDPDGEKNVKVK